MHDFKPYRSLLSAIPLLTCCEWRDCSCSPSPRRNGLNLHHYVTSISIWVEIASKSEKIKENCTFFFEQPIKWHPHLAKNTSTLNTIWEKSEENKVQRKKWKQKNKKEKKRKERKKRRRDFGAFLSRVYVCAHSNRNVVFLLSQVSHGGKKIGENSIEKWEN